MFFKHTLQTLTGANFPSGFPNNTLREELTLIEQNKYDLSFEDYLHWRKLTIDAYHTVYEAKDALVTAKKSYDNKDEWLRAYDKAQKADVAMSALLKRKLDEIPFQYYYDPNILFVAVTVLFLFDFSKLSYLNELTETQLNSLASGLFLLMLLLLVVPGMVFDKNKAKLATTLVGHHWCSIVLAEARKSGIEINTNQNVVPGDQPWSNAQLLADIHCEEISEEFNCPISHNVMTKPVYCSQHKARFDKALIHDWLYQENTHPLTRESMFWDELLPDTALEGKIADFTRQRP